MAYLVGVAKRIRRMKKKMMERISAALRPAKRRIFPEPNPSKIRNV